MMIIVSQDGTSLINFDNVTEIRVKKVTQFLKPDENSERVPRVPRVPVETYKIAIFFIGEEDYVSIGEFKTEEKAMGVLDDFLTNLFNNVFGIPKDEVTE